MLLILVLVLSILNSFGTSDAGSVTSDFEEELSSAEVDYIRITDEVDGEVLEGGGVPPGHVGWGYLSAYNHTEGFVGNYQGEWYASHGGELIGDGYGNSEGIDVGTTSGDVWFNVTYMDHHHGVKYTVITDEVHDVRITESPGGEPLQDRSVHIGTTIQGHCSVYNETSDYIYTAEGNWTAEGGNSELLEDTPNEYNVIDVGSQPGLVWFNLTYEGSTDSIEFEVLPPTIDEIRITDVPGGEPLTGGDVPVGYRVWGNVSAFNETHGYISTVEADWDLEYGEDMDPDMGPSPSHSNRLDVGHGAGDITWSASYSYGEEVYSDTVEFRVLEPRPDQVRITHDGSELEGGTVPVGHRVEVELSAFNDTSGFIGLVDGVWDVQGGNAYLLDGTTGMENTLDVGTVPDTVQLTGNYEGMDDTLYFEVMEPGIDYILIRDRPDGGGDVLDDITLGFEGSLDMYAAGYNNTMGYVEEVYANWYLDHDNVGEITETHGTGTTFYPKDLGVCNVTAEHEGQEHTAQITVTYTHDPKIVGTIPDLELNSNFGVHEINLIEYADDEYDPHQYLRWYVTGIDGSLIDIYGENQTGNHVITLISQKDTVGSMRVEYRLVNSAGNEASQEAWINITDTYEPPRLRRCPDLFVHHDEPYEFSYAPYIIYDEDRKHELTLETDDPEHTEVRGLRVIYEYPESMLGEEVVVMITVSDGIESDNTAISVTVTTNHPPEKVERLPDVEILQGEVIENVFNLDDYFMDPEGDPLYMSYGYTYLSITIHGDHTVDIRADVHWHGVERVTFRAKDPVGAIVEQTINVTVIPVNYPPEIKELPRFYVHYDEPYTFDLRYYISDKDNETHELTITTCSPEYVTVTGTRMTMLYPKRIDDERDTNYNVTLEVFVSDGIDTVSQVTVVTVGDIYPPELIIPLHDVAFRENERLLNAFNLDNHFIDRQDDTMYYTSGNDYIEVTIHENSSVDFSAPRNWNGQELITIRATNEAGALMEDSLMVTVIPVNNPPMISDIPQQEGMVGRSWILDMGDYISDVDNETHELQVYVDDPNVDVLGHKLVFEYQEEGRYNVTVEVSDGIDTNTTHIDVIVRAEESDRLISPWFGLLLIPLGIGGAVYHYKKSKYTVEDIFLIHDSGVLIKHHARTEKAERDEDILAGMFLAVNNFVEDAFGGQEKDTLKRMEYGDHIVLVHKGKNVILAVFISDNVPSWLLESMAQLVDDIEDRYGDEIVDWSGDVDKLPGIDEMLAFLLRSRGRYEHGDWKKSSR